MQKFTVIGINEITYKNKSTKQDQKAIILYTTYDFRKEDNADGVGCEAFFCTGDVYDDASVVSVGDTISVSYGKNSSFVSSIQIV
jgi:hypothetical protein